MAFLIHLFQTLKKENLIEEICSTKISISQLNFKEELITNLSKENRFSELKELKITNSILNLQNSKPIFEELRLKNNNNLENLILSYNQFDKEFVEVLLASFLKENGSLKQLSLNNNKFLADNLPFLLKCLKNDKTISKLDLSFVNLEYFILPLSKLITKNQKVRFLNLSFNNFQDLHTMNQLTDSLKQNQHITDLILSGTKVKIFLLFFFFFNFLHFF